MERNLTTQEYVALGMTSLEPQSGYSIRSAFSLGAFRLSSSPGSIYPMLKRLERNGLMTGKIETLHETRARKMYSPTPLGEQLLDEWLHLPVSKEEVVTGKDLLLLKFLFMERRLGRPKVIAWLTTYTEALELYEQLLRAQRDPQMKEWSLHQQLLIEATIMDLGVQRAWIGVARQRLQLPERPPA
jgi:DNA-binding PadR family transcriptional regulator